MLAVKAMSALHVAMREVTHSDCVGDVGLLAARGRSGLKACSYAALSSLAAAGIVSPPSSQPVVKSDSTPLPPDRSFCTTGGRHAGNPMSKG